MSNRPESANNETYRGASNADSVIGSSDLSESIYITKPRHLSTMEPATTPVDSMMSLPMDKKSDASSKLKKKRIVRRMSLSPVRGMVNSQMQLPLSGSIKSIRKGLKIKV